MPFRSIEQGIAAIQQGNLDEGARLIRIALKSPEIQGSVRATAYLWLAETVQDPQGKIEYYNQALAVDPNNQHARQRVAQLLSSSLPPSPQSPAASPSIQQATPTQPQYGHTPQSPAQPTPQPPMTPGFPAQSQGVAPQQPAYSAPQGYMPTQQLRYDPTMLYRTVGIYDGPNGAGTGMFVTRDGLVATTRFVVGGEQHVTIELEAGNRFPGHVVRAFPLFDLALIHTGLTINQLLPTAPTPMILDNTPLVAVAHNGKTMQGQKRATKSQIKPEWFLTTIAQMADAGGNPVFDNRNMLVGMLTNNANRSSAYVFGLSINIIYRHVEQYIQEIQSGVQAVYCPHCGHLSRAGGAGAFYCEVCGGTLPTAQNAARYQMPHMAAFYNETAHRACPHCKARVGYYDGKCLRCGHEVQ